MIFLIYSNNIAESGSGKSTFIKTLIKHFKPGILSDQGNKNGKKKNYKKIFSLQLIFFFSIHRYSIIYSNRRTK